MRTILKNKKGDVWVAESPADLVRAQSAGYVETDEGSSDSKVESDPRATQQKVTEPPTLPSPTAGATAAPSPSLTKSK
ncbi:hypothetical protein KXR83_05790 [Williamsia muralis]|uniref:hypothetical protein n=1 Tax=Williamsia marianensis TaxID=85044 RepID=UPI003F155872